MGIDLKSPLLAAIPMKLENVFREQAMLLSFVKENRARELTELQEWSAVTTMAVVIHNIYNGLEEAMKVICRNVDGHIPSGGTSHQDILDQLAMPRKGLRGAVLTETLYDDLVELKGFRHVVNHGYAFGLEDERVLKNLERLECGLPAFVQAIRDLDRDLAGPQGSGDLSDGPP